MKKAILATKVGMTQIFNEDGVLTPVTVLQAGPCVVTQVKTVENDGYDAVQVGFADIREKLVNKPVKGHFDKAEVPYKRFLREFKFENASEYSVKDEIKADIFAASGIESFVSVDGEGFFQFFDRTGFLFIVTIIAVEHFLEGPLRPVIIFRVASTDFTVPVERETYFVELLAVAVDIVDGSDGRMLSGLDSILLGGQAVSVVSHRIEYIEALQSFVTGVNVRSDISQRVSYV